ncbi:hypothetical protein [Streptomyces mangrovisoli]|uniref:Uncharacterized protein n=1 Tax=Streptomyces mangrovisoli TaxID=1428628 RepID=A0A1J4NQZ3_9ACTN|nr:hypothetical protein [Streptomyces mangrovisoli]OIJ63669.1 hypothetical protein WN71_033170 [Streptomyces mangrovisoli]
MFQEAPIYRQLIAERGDVPAQVRGEAERIARDLQRVMPPMRVSAPVAAERAWSGAHGASAAPALPPGAQLG